MRVALALVLILFVSCGGDEPLHYVSVNETAVWCSKPEIISTRKNTGRIILLGAGSNNVINERYAIFLVDDKVTPRMRIGDRSHGLVLLDVIRERSGIFVAEYCEE